MANMRTMRMRRRSPALLPFGMAAIIFAWAASGYRKDLVANGATRPCGGTLAFCGPPQRSSPGREAEVVDVTAPLPSAMLPSMLLFGSDAVWAAPYTPADEGGFPVPTWVAWSLIVALCAYTLWFIWYFLSSIFGDDDDDD
mmetsp:Transcript_69725/g.130172  ORF Transcript_69725/g.130172 Transcript_69725/m.130172 type:complete len:141 (-) Transcript_69725:69-491(-)